MRARASAMEPCWPSKEFGMYSNDGGATECFSTREVTKSDFVVLVLQHKKEHIDWAFAE